MGQTHSVTAASVETTSSTTPLTQLPGSYPAGPPGAAWVQGRWHLGGAPASEASDQRLVPPLVHLTGASLHSQHPCLRAQHPGPQHLHSLIWRASCLKLKGMARCHWGSSRVRGQLTSAKVQRARPTRGVRPQGVLHQYKAVPCPAATLTRPRPTLHPTCMPRFPL
jgi:hypothetical protein